MPEAIRTCVGCRRKAAQQELVRLHLDPDSDLIEAAASPGPSRGAWLHRDEACLATALQRRAISRALRIAPGGAPESTRLSPAAYAFLGDRG